MEEKNYVKSNVKGGINMYITETTDKVKELIEKVEKIEDLNKLKFLIYIFGLLNNNQINDKNEANPDLVEEDMKILNLEVVGLSQNSCTILLEYFTMLYNIITEKKDAYVENGNVLGVVYDKADKEILSKFERLEFNEKLDVFSEIVIRYDNETYFKNKITNLTFDSKLNGFDIAKLIKDFKN